MDEIETIIDELTGIEHVIIDNGNQQFTSMTKAHYDALKEAEHLNGSGL